MATGSGGQQQPSAGPSAQGVMPHVCLARSDGSQVPFSALDVHLSQVCI